MAAIPRVPRSEPDCPFPPPVRVAVPMTEQESNGKALASLKNLAAERYWDSRWQREWETKYHDPLVVIMPRLTLGIPSTYFSCEIRM